ncbi:hypothetical protein KXQ82_07845 [Mucilaginibacter sp. HMF5004]|uniref:hypothetical protein n=1 Tax=Mucilaginibacter rivuli TaxID=2857527 RepID=UPI001C5EDC7B|nr:hypothetical protein [Mucilaginibacter rivuli]MBW4889623.1 hypothetical protein [Mucilaginibacter rivuli]
MKPLLFCLCIGFIIGLGSCSKSSVDSNTNYSLVPDTGVYIVKAGTITAVSPDGTYIFNGEKDNITLYHRKDKKNPEIWSMYCYGSTGGGFEIDAPVVPTTGNSALSLSRLYVPPPQNLNYYYYSYSNTNAGTVTMNTYNSNGVAALGTFTLNVGTYLNSYSRLGFTNYTITGSFDLKLNAK